MKSPESKRIDLYHFNIGAGVLNSGMEIILILLLSIIATNVFSQEKKINSIGIRSGLVKNSYYDESFNFKSYHNTTFNPFQLRFGRHSGKNAYVFDFIYLSNHLDPVKRESAVQFDEIDLQSGVLSFAWYRQIYISQNNFSVHIGAKLMSTGYGAERTFFKNYPQLGNQEQTSFEITLFSLSATTLLSYPLSDKIDISASADVLLFGLMTRNYNPKVSPFEDGIQVGGMGKQSGFDVELSIVKRLNRFSLELFDALYYARYKAPYLKKLLTNKAGISIYYEF